jgi:hypothetical protein
LDTVDKILRYRKDGRPINVTQGATPEILIPKQLANKAMNVPGNFFLLLDLNSNLTDT